MDSRQWNGSDDRELGGPPPRTPEQTFRKHWRVLKAKGNRAAMLDFLDFHAAYPALFGHLVEECREEMAEQERVLVRLDVEAGELVDG